MSEVSVGRRLFTHARAQNRTQDEIAAATGLGLRTVSSVMVDGPAKGENYAAIIREVAPPEEQQELALRVLARVEPELYALAGAPVAVEG